MSDIVVVGSLNMDMVVKVDRRPDRGETVLGNGFFMSPGGKGANQAYAAGALGASVTMIGRLGEDVFADAIRNNLAKVGVDTSTVDTVPTDSSGVALISIDSEGDNSIIVAPGVNMSITADDIRAKESIIKQAKLLIVQLEIPLEAVMEAVEIAHQHGVQVLLDPAPAQPLPDHLLQMIDYITPNQTEILQLTGVEVTDADSAKDAADVLLNKGVKTVFAKLGSKGVTIVTSNQLETCSGYEVAVLDTTAAGDAFAGAIGTAIVEGKDVCEAAKFANAVGALTVTRYGAQQSMPNRQETEIFIREHTTK